MTYNTGDYVVHKSTGNIGRIITAPLNAFDRFSGIYLVDSAWDKGRAFGYGRQRHMCSNFLRPAKIHEIVEFRLS